MAVARGRPTCVNHPHRDLVAKCDRCLRDFCVECLPDRDDGRLCARCRQELAAALEIYEGARLTPGNVMRRLISRRFFAAVLVLGVVLTIGLLPAFFALRQTTSEGIDPNVIRRIQVGYGQVCDLAGEGCDHLEIVWGGEATASSQSTDPRHQLDRVHDGLVDQQFDGWRSGDANFPIDLTFKLRFRTPIAKIIVWNDLDEPADTYIRDFELWVAVDDPVRNPDAMTRIGRFVMGPQESPSRFELAEPTVAVTWVRIRILASQGPADYVSAAEIGAFSPARDVPGAPLPRGSGPLPI
ncbi:MAG: hypothetical protein FJ029_01550 [Actinobacteria bacterium]|nr:hypothetical protein [Actinomycetota bacterium]